jgi:hypothetical protein
VASVTSLFNSPAADITLERVRELVSQNLPESLTLEYKAAYSSSLVNSVAAMANSYGGLILVGVTDQAQPNRLVGVPDPTVVQIVNACHDKLEPPWEPEIIPVALDGSGQAYVLVVRVDHSRAPRPLLIDGHAPIRLQGRNAKADRSRLAQLFSEPSAPPQQTGRLVMAPEFPTGNDGSPAADFVIRSGLVLPVGEVAAWRPLSDRGVGLLADALNGSPLNGVLLWWCGNLAISGCNPFHRSGFNRARHARLAWQAATDFPPRHPIEAIAVADLPSRYGVPGSTLQFTLDVIVRMRAFLAVRDAPRAMGARLAVPHLYETLDAILGTLTSDDVVRALADLAGIDPVVAPQPGNLFFQTGPEVGELLYIQGLTPIEDAGPSHGAQVLANPSLDLANPAERRTQLDDWLQQIGLDAGLRGMESLLADFHRQEAS